MYKPKDWVKWREEKGCRISISSMDESSPLILKLRSRTEDTPFHMPNSPGSDFLTFLSGEALRFACPDAKDNLLLMPNSPFVGSETRVSCWKDSVFTINDVAYNFSDIKCLKPPQSIVTEVGHCSTENVVKGRIGFNLNYEFLEVIEVCYDNLRHMTVHTTHKLNRNVASAETEFDRKNYILFELFETPDQFYKCKNQIMSLGHLFNSQTQAQKYIDCDKGGDMYLTKAHLVPKNDFLFGFQQKATSYDITTAPQWQTINSGNWRILENRIRRYANSNNVDLTITTGALNVLELPNLFDVPQFLQLTKGENNTFVSIPTLFWKLVHDRTNNSGIVFVLINNPYKNFRRTRAYVVCTCVCARTKSWFDGLDRFDRKKGYIYCCTLEDFRARTEMKYYPFTVKNLLE